jgi:hypothetical protein
MNVPSPPRTSVPTLPSLTTDNRQPTTACCHPDRGICCSPEPSRFDVSFADNRQPTTDNRQRPFQPAGRHNHSPGRKPWVRSPYEGPSRLQPATPPRIRPRPSAVPTRFASLILLFLNVVSPTRDLLLPATAHQRVPYISRFRDVGELQAASHQPRAAILDHYSNGCHPERGASAPSRRTPIVEAICDSRPTPARRCGPSVPRLTRSLLTLSSRGGRQPDKESALLTTSHWPPTTCSVIPTEDCPRPPRSALSP